MLPIKIHHSEVNTRERERERAREMDPCPFVRLIVESLALKLPSVAKPAGPGVHPSATPCFCTVQLQDCPSSSATQTAPLPLAVDPTSTTNLIEPAASTCAVASSAVVISIEPAALRRPSGRPASLTVAVYAGRTGSTCGFSSGRLLGRVRVAVDLESAATRAAVIQSGWVSMGSGLSAARLHLVVRTEPDPRFVFQFGSEPECSPVVYQIQGGGGTGHGGCVRQPVFSCRFSADRRRTTRTTSPPTKNNRRRCWFGSLGGERDHESREQRKGWTVTIHDLSGSPVAAASIVTPFVASPGSDRVSRSNPGAWLILRAVGPSATDWKPWGRLEAWREKGPVDALGYRFELMTDAGPNRGFPIVESSLSMRKGGRFCIDPGVVEKSGPFAGGFVMAATVEGQGKVSKPTVQVGVQHVSCMADVALFIALSAAIDLSGDACQLFSHKLRKELSQDQQEYAP
ncbi:uncharacterized protein LOC103992782 [Musa acuminata AAA Group]|uniref:(wild Malaysian banana) hypothetical protein n=1 Tax=Musa acuminata subsp. malaccensis TaxID=214687 RepID=A0A804K046_MUSAM|nr:PREDICTED: uncharacterized protein LOC103992782 [Musa acuminata subsp. malaccensis]CAG1857834.1 unnamed protein product [Musa acuminata subsp. malaccensis]